MSESPYCSATAMVCVGAPAEKAPLAPKHWGVLTQYCVKCHNTEDWAGGVAFDAMSPADIATDAQTWEEAIRKLRTGMMPPAGKARPPRAVLDGLATELATRLDDAAAPHPFPGAHSLHRLNRTEYANAIHDLLSFDVDATSFAARRRCRRGPRQHCRRIERIAHAHPELHIGGHGNQPLSGRRSHASAHIGEVRRAFRPVAGRVYRRSAARYAWWRLGHTQLSAGCREYEFRSTAVALGLPVGSSGEGPPLVDVTIDGQQVKVADTNKFRIHRLKPGPRVIGAGALSTGARRSKNEFYAKAVQSASIDNISINGPYDPTGTGETPSRRAIFVCYPQQAQQEDSCARRT